MASEEKRRAGTMVRVRELAADYGAVLGMGAVLIILGIIDPRFFRVRNLLGVLNSSAILIMLSLAMMMAMAVRGVNLCVAQTTDAAAVLAAMLLINRCPMWSAVLAALGFGLLVGLINAFVISYLGVPAIIGTLGMMFAIRSFELIVTNGAQPQILFSLPPARTRAFFFIGQGSIGPVPFLIVLTLLVVALFYFIKERSTLGRRMDAVWGNAKAARLASINIRAVFGSAFVISCLLAAVAGVAMASRTGNAVPRGAETYLMDTFVSCYLGMLISKRNKLNVIGTALGAIFVGLLNNWFTLMSVGAPFRNLFNGLFIIAAVAIGVMRMKRKT